ncbi:YadA-like family protein, partial [Halomonas alkaliantarctica]|uniref:YadA-like family protein n=1 Tax=Halomonas alkaliantarctica TaxID=232346 RepID=UPI00265B5586
TVAYTSEDGSIITTVSDNAIDFALGNNLSVGQAGQDGVDGVDGTIGVNGADGSSIVLNGKDGTIGLTGPAGADGSPGANGTIGVVNGVPGVDGKDGITRIVIDDIEVATMEDGLKFQGDDREVVTRKLNETLGLTGGADVDALTGGNIGITKDSDGSLRVQLAQNLSGLTEVAITDGPTINNGGIDMGDTKITNLAPGTDGKDAVNVDQLNDVEAIANQGFNITADNADLADDATVDNVKLGETAAYRSEDGSIITTVKDNEIDFALGNNLSVGQAGQDGVDGVDGTIGVNGADGSSIVLNGKDGTIGLTGPAGADGSPGANGTIGVVNGVPGVDGKDGITRIVIDDIEVATMEDGLKFGANDGDVHNAKLNTQVDITGAVGNTDWSAFDEGQNIMTQVDGNNITVALARDLTGLNSATFGDITGDTFFTINDIGAQFIDGTGSQVANTPSITIGGIDAGNQTITNVAPGEVSATSTDAINGSQLQAVSDQANAPLTFAGNTNSIQKRLGETVSILGNGDKADASYSADNIKTIVNAEGNLMVMIDKDPTFDTVVLNDGNNGLSFYGIDGATGSRGIDGEDGLSRIAYIRDDADGNPIEETIATLSDGLIFEGDDEVSVLRNLNETLSLTGGATGELSENNIGITHNGEGGLKVQLANNLTGLENITSNNLTVTGETKLGDRFVVNGDQVTYNIAPEGITEGNQVVNKDYVDNAGDQLIATNPLTFGADEGEDTQRRLGERLDIVGEADEKGNRNIVTKLTDKQTLALALNDDLEIGNSISVGDSGPVISADGISMGDNKITNMADGDVSADSKDAINGSQLYQLESIVTNVTGDISNEYVTDNGLGIRYVRTNDRGLSVSDAFAQGQGSTAVGYEARAAADRALALGYQAVASHQGSVALGEGSVTADTVRTTSVVIAGTTYQFAGAGEGVVSTVSVGSEGNERTVTNVAAGRISAESTDAINGSQLYATNQAVGALDSRVTNVEGDISNITNDLADLDDRAVKYDRNDDNSVDYSTITLAGDNGTTITNVAPGDVTKDSMDAVNGSQLWEVSNQITNIEQGGSKYFRANSEGPAANPQGADSIAMGPSSVAAGDRSVASGAGAQANTEGSVALGAGSVADREGMNGERERFSNEAVASTQGAVSVGSAGNERQITNVAGGTQATDAVNVRQLEAVQRGAVNYDRDEDGNVNYNTITLRGEEGTTITNVAPGINETDAVNVGQMNELGRRFTNEINNVHGRIDSVERNANAGSASAIAASTVPQAWMPGKSMIGVGAGTYGGESAISVGVSRLSDNGRWIIQGKITGDSQSNFGAGIGAGWHW